MTDYWKTLEYPNGPYIPLPQLKLTLIHKKSGKQVRLSPTDTQIAIAYAKLLLAKDKVLEDPVWSRNFSNSFNFPPTFNINNTDWSDIIKYVKDHPDVPLIDQSIQKKHNTIIVNGVPHRMTVFQIPDAGIHASGNKRGTVRRNLTVDDLTLNVTSTNQTKGYKHVLSDKSQMWVVRWRDPVTSEYKYLSIPPSAAFVTRAEAVATAEEDDDVEQDVEPDDDRLEVDYPDDDLPPDSDTDDLPGDEVPNDEHTTVKRIVEQDKNNVIKLDKLTETERASLPLSHLKSSFEQWYILDRALKSGFSHVWHLDKVTDYNLEKFMQYLFNALHTHSITINPTHRAFINYAKQRGLKI